MLKPLGKLRRCGKPLYREGQNVEMWRSLQEKKLLKLLRNKISILQSNESLGKGVIFVNHPGYVLLSLLRGHKETSKKYREHV